MEMIKKFNEDYPNGSIQVTRIMTEDPEKGEYFKATVRPDVSYEKRFFTWYGWWEKVREAQLEAINFSLSYLYS